jgi:hypothetical protein
MGGEGSGNRGSKKFGNKFYRHVGLMFTTKLKAEQFVKEIINAQKFHPYKIIYTKLPTPRYDVYYLPGKYIRPSGSRSRYNEDGTIRY